MTIATKTEQQTPVATATVAAHDLSRYLRIVRRFTDTEGYPPLYGVHLEAAHGVAALTATNRFMLGHARLTAGGELPPTVVHRYWARVIADALDTLDGGAVVHLRRVAQLAGEPTLEVATGAGYGGFRIEVPAIKGEFPDVKFVLAEPHDDALGLDGPIGINPGLVVPFAKAMEDLASDGPIPRWHFGGARKPVRVQIGEHFLGAIMPANLDDAALPVMPVGLPSGAA